jgi:hypothetical protein
VVGHPQRTRDGRRGHERGCQAGQGEEREQSPWGGHLITIDMFA